MHATSLKRGAPKRGGRANSIFYPELEIPTEIQHVSLFGMTSFDLSSPPPNNKWMAPAERSETLEQIFRFLIQVQGNNVTAATS